MILGSIMSLIMPKQDGTIDTLETTLDIYYENQGNFVSNATFKEEFRRRANLDADINQALLVKKSEIARYFGLVDNNHFVGNQAQITERGIRYKEAIDNNSKIEIIFESLENDSFGQNNCAIKSSDSIIDPPILLLKAIYELSSVSRQEFAYLLYATSDLNIPFNEAILTVYNSRDGIALPNLPTGLISKYNDTKFLVFFKNLGILEIESHHYQLTNYVYHNFLDRISSLSIYNEVRENDVVDHVNLNEIIERPITNENVLEELNNRLPESEEQPARQRYKTNNRIKKTSIQRAGYLCVNNNEHTTFINKDGETYMEGHHLIPMSAQIDFPAINLDRVSNIVCLCPTCHREIHYANEETRYTILKALYDERSEILAEEGIVISFEELKRYYI